MDEIIIANQILNRKYEIGRNSRCYPSSRKMEQSYFPKSHETKRQELIWEQTITCTKIFANAAAEVISLAHIGKSSTRLGILAAYR